MKKKPQRYSHKKLLSTRARPDLQSQSNQKSHFINPPQSSGPKSSARNRSAQKILSVYESSRAKFKLGKFLNDKTYRIKTQNDEFQKTKTNFTKPTHGIKGSGQNIKQREKFKDKEDKTGRLYTNSGTHKAINPNNTMINNKSKVYQGDERLKLPLDMATKQRTFNKRLNLNSQLFDQAPFMDSSLQKNMIPQTSKHQKRNNFSFRKQHDSYRAGNKKTALEKYISESLENLQCPVKKKNSRNVVKEKSKDKTHGQIMMINSGSKQKQQRQFSQIEDKKRLLIYKGSKQNEKELKKGYQSMMHNTDELVHSHCPKQQSNLENPSTHRRLQTQQDDSLQKIEIKWQKKRKNPYDMSNEEMQTFGDRFPDGFQKMRLLGRGGFSLVWLGEHKKSRKQYAVKQIITESNHQTHKKEIQFGKYFFQFGGVPKQEFLQHPGIKNLVKLYYYFINKKDTWLLYEKCGDSLGNVLYELKGQHYNGQKMYRIHYKEFYSIVRNDQLELKKIIYEVAKALLLLSQNNIVHSDLKTQNILVKLKSQEKQCQKTLTMKTSGRKDASQTLDVRQSARNQLKNQSVIQEVKLIDYGSSFQFTNLRQFSMATPEYMAPQILNFILYENQLEYVPKLFDYVQSYHNPWVIDVWSLGCVLLEIISGIPLWMSLKTIVKRKSKELIRYGLFAVKGRTFDKIIRKQLEVVQNLEQFLIQQNYSDIVPDEDIKYLLKKMLALNPNKRISPGQIVTYLEKIVNQ